jgi:YbbR domain-containing protein
VNLITDDWRLKVLALGLAVLLLGAVAFSQNPPTQKVLRDVSISYTMGPEIIVISPPSKTNVTVKGLADAIAAVNADNVAASFDLTKATPGPNVHVNLVIRPLISNVTVQNPVVPYVLNVDTLATRNLAIEVRIPQRPVQGWQLTKKEALCPNACTAAFTGPASWEDNLTAFADFPFPVQQDSQTVPSIPVHLLQNGVPLDLTRFTQPLIKLEPSTVAIHVEAKPGTTLRQVVLIDAPPSHGPATGYRVTNVTIDPGTIVISGPADALATITTITLPPMDLTGATSNKAFQVVIPLPRPDITGSVGVAKVTYSISVNPNAPPPPPGG